MKDIIRQRLLENSKPEKIEILSSFFKTGKGQYAEGDKFIGVNVPDNRKIAKEFRNADYETLEELITSPIHEERLCALLILVQKFNKADKDEKNRIFDFYLKHTKNINNWDLVDLSAPYICGAHLLDSDKDILYKLAESDNLWERRISIVSTMWFIRKGRLEDTINITTILLHDKHDLIQKACGWMLREAGKKDLNTLISFLDKYSQIMPRTMLRYSIEKLDKETRAHYMKRQ